jgi:hypothetical protein
VELGAATLSVLFVKVAVTVTGTAVVVLVTRTVVVDVIFPQPGADVESPDMAESTAELREAGGIAVAVDDAAMFRRVGAAIPVELAGSSPSARSIVSMRETV